MLISHPRTAIAAVTLAAVALIGGCSSSSKDASSATTTATSATATSGTTKAEFVAAANALCTKSNAAMNEAGSGESSDSLSEGVPGMESQAQILQKTIDELKALPQPTGADSTEDLYAPLDDMMTAIDDLITAAKADDEAAAEKASDALTTASDDANRVWTAYGVSECGSDSSDSTDTTAA